MELPSELRESLDAGWAAGGGQDWVSELPARLADAERRWDITLQPPFQPGGYTSYVAPATTAGGTASVYKCTIPHDEAVGEAEALAAYDGEGAVRLLASRAESFELLIERCEPGDSLWGEPSEDARFDIACNLLRGLWRPHDSDVIRDLATVADAWAEVMRNRLERHGCPWGSGPIERAIGVWRSLPRDRSPSVLIHGDFHPGNVLRARRMPWLVIDPKPMIGDPAYEPAQLLTQQSGRLAAPPAAPAVEQRLVAIADRLDLDAERVGLWSLARTAEWSMWSLAHDAPEDAHTAHQWATVLNDLV